MLLWRLIAKHRGLYQPMLAAPMPEVTWSHGHVVIGRRNISDQQNQVLNVLSFRRPRQLRCRLDCASPGPSRLHPEDAFAAKQATATATATATESGTSAIFDSIGLERLMSPA
jgi:hypothetical protein